MSRVSIIVRCKGHPELTTACLESIRANTEHPYEIILCDDGSQWGEQPAHLADYYVYSKESHGAVTATNNGLVIAADLPGDYVMVMDNDTEVPKGDSGWLGRMIAEMSEEPDTAAIGATSGSVSGAQHVLLCPQTYTGDFDSGQKANPPVPAFVSFCVLLAKAAVRQVGPWDEQYNPGNFEDTDYALQLRARGYSIRVARSVYIHHRCHSTFGEKMGELMATNQQKFADKWGVGRLFDMNLISGEAMVKLLAEGR